MVQLRFVRLAALALAVTMILWLIPSAHAVFTITLTPSSGVIGTHVTITGSEPNPGAPSLDPACVVSSSPSGLISSSTCTVTQTGAGTYTVSGSFIVAAAGSYVVTVTVNYGPGVPPGGAYASASDHFGLAASPIAPIAVGGEMLPINRVHIILPWIVLIVVLGTLSTCMIIATLKIKSTKRK